MDYREIDTLLAAAKPKAQIAIGAPLYLQKHSGGASILFRYKAPARPGYRMLKLFEYTAANLVSARDEAERLAALVARKIDPADKREADEVAKVAARTTFKSVAENYITKHAPTWSAKHTAQWRSTLKEYAYPTLGNKAVQDITRDDIVRLLTAHVQIMGKRGRRGSTPFASGTFWAVQPVSATRVAKRIETILDVAKANGARTGDNVAEWKVLKKSEALAVMTHKATHHPMVPWAEAPALFAKLAGRTLKRSRALMLAYLTAARANTVRLATWGEFDLAAATWSVAAERMQKNDLPWRTHLPAFAVAMLRSIMPANPAPGAYVFEGGKPGKPMSHDAMVDELHHLTGSTEYSVHGSTRGGMGSWSQGRVNDTLSEYQLHHVSGAGTVAAYKRDDLLAMRVPVVEQWAAYLTQHVVAERDATQVVVSIRKTA
jgi:integrase